jgi:hypothetical protein
MMDKEYLDEILNTFKWIKVNNEYFTDNPEEYDANSYKRLLEHHKKETEFLINKCRELAKELKAIQEG